MALTNLSGPQVTFGVTLTSSGADFEHNPDRGPSFCDLGEGLLDPRPPFMFSPGQGSSKPFYGWAGLFGGPVVDQAPFTTSTNNIATTQVPTSGTALTLATNTSQGFGAAVTINAYEGGTVSIRPIDGAMGGLAFGVSGTANLWDPTKAVARCIAIYGSSNASSAETYTIVGRDLYGQKITELVTAAVGASQGSTGVINSSVATISKKAYKYIASITPGAGVVSTNVTVGVTDIYGFPLRVDHPGYVTVWAGPTSSVTLVAVSTGYHTLAVTSAASNTTGDVRGTIATSGVGSVSNASLGVVTSTGSAQFKVVMFISPSAQNLQGASLGSSYPAGIVGLQQFSSV